MSLFVLSFRTFYASFAFPGVLCFVRDFAVDVGLALDCIELKEERGVPPKKLLPRDNDPTAVCVVVPQKPPQSGHVN